MKRIKLVFLLSILSVGLATAQGPCNDPTSMGPDCDFDGDGIINSLDLDDDNDGVLDIVEGVNTITEFGYQEDILIGGFHNVLARTVDGELVGWGAYLAPDGKGNLVLPTVISPANGYNYQGSVLKFALATNYVYSSEGVILTEAGLYAWGIKNAQTPSNYFYALLPPSVKSGNLSGFAKVKSLSTYGMGTLTNSYSLPADYIPSDVEILYGGVKSLMVVTTDGKLWVLGENQDNYGDNSGVSDGTWHQVQLPAGEEVFKVRSSLNFGFVQTKSGNLYTWGLNSILGDGSSESNRPLPTLMVNPLPQGERIIQIAVNLHDYYILSSGGNVYSLGQNITGEAGREAYDASTEENKYYYNWGKVTNQDGSYLENVRFISANDNDANFSSVSVILEDKSVRAWGRNDARLFGGPIGGVRYHYPVIPLGSEGQEYSYVESGGHITPIIKADGSYCNVGHNSQSSFGDGSTGSTTINEYQCVLPAGTFKFVASNTIEENRVDTDGDGIPNSFDLDSDGDGCPDSKESGLINYMEGINGAISSPGTTTNGNGIDASSNTTLEIEGAIVGRGIPTDYGENGFYNLIEDADNSEAVYTGVYTYEPAIDQSIDSECLVVQKEVYSNPAMRSIKYRQKN